MSAGDPQVRGPQPRPHQTGAVQGERGYEEEEEEELVVVVAVGFTRGRAGGVGGLMRDKHAQTHDRLSTGLGDMR